MSMPVRILPAAFVLLAFTSQAQQLTPRTPGLWQIDSKVQMVPPGMTRGDSEKLCITPELATRNIAPRNALEDDGWKCTSAAAAVTPAKASYTTTCRQGSDRATGTGEVVMNGSKEFKGTTIIDADMEGMKVRVTAEYKGKFVSADCGKAPLMKWEGFTEKPRK